MPAALSANPQSFLNSSTSTVAGFSPFHSYSSHLRAWCFLSFDRFQKEGYPILLPFFCFKIELKYDPLNFFSCFGLSIKALSIIHHQRKWMIGLMVDLFLLYYKDIGLLLTFFWGKHNRISLLNQRPYIIYDYSYFSEILFVLWCCKNSYSVIFWPLFLSFFFVRTAILLKPDFSINIWFNYNHHHIAN